MTYCPKCGAKTEENEAYCVLCGAQLPKNIKHRTEHQSGFSKWWLTPIFTIITMLVIGIGLHFFLEHSNNQAEQLYEQGVENALDGQYNRAHQYFNEALDYKENYEAARTNAEFMEIALGINNQLQTVDTLIEREAFQQALKITQEAENELSSYNGEIINHLLEAISEKRNHVRISQVETQLSNEPSIEELKMLLWQVDSINHSDSDELVSMMRERIVNHTISEANEFLQENQFNQALSVVKDGLRFDEENERLTSLQTTIERQKISFESEQQERIEQALTQYELEQEQNQENAIELVSVETEINEFGDILVKGQLKSVATIPIHSISVEYSLLDEDENVVEENETFLFPETLYPDETGDFEHTHYDIPEDCTVNIDKISWYLEGE
ncbi:zinc ribbon domain-containing protein [Halalkalibacillus halophilus]|uniref:zinc ribbon domain-containing protein n=1 Tax=Halalkalibacillus halophilus TaxID=392827 RepID=UPI0003F960D8|nr:zinc ribbon domain-containing protein [Halalkalibacillus halophilus]